MKIYSWNMFFGNKTPDRAFEFIRDTEWDIFCLQEVPESFLTRIKTLPLHVASAVESTRVNTGDPFSLYVVILSRYLIRDSAPIVLPEVRGRRTPIREAVYRLIMSTAGVLTRRIGRRLVLRADIETPTGLVRVFCLHLSLRYPLIRAAEFETVMHEHDPAQPSIVCGDFNILESLHINPINFFRGGRVSDVLCYKRERTQMEKRFAEQKLLNPLHGHKTHPLSQSQLDHILVSNTFSPTQTEVIKDRHGSDHCPVRIEIE